MPFKNKEDYAKYHKNYRKRNRKILRLKDKKRWKNNPDRRKHRDRYISDNPEKIREYQIKFLYGLSFEEYRELVVLQNNRCAICGLREKRKNYRTGKVQNLSVDHNHKTGKVRELLCSNCNRALGLLKESEELLLRVIAYIRKHKETINGY